MSCRAQFAVPGVGAPLYFKHYKPYCPVKACYKYMIAPACPNTPYSSTHKCEEISPKRKVWKCAKGAGIGKYVTKSGETVQICQCSFNKVSSSVLVPVKEYAPKCY